MILKNEATFLFGFLLHDNLKLLPAGDDSARKTDAQDVTERFFIERLKGQLF